MVWLASHQHIAYVAILAGSYFETLIGLSFFIPGELFFIPAAILAGAGVLNIWWVALACYTGGILGDLSSFMIGRKAGQQFLKILNEKKILFNPKNYKRGENFFKSHGPKAIFIARIAGPFSWITPFLAGIYKVPYKTFLHYNIPGVLIGIGWFLVVGYFFASSFQTILSLTKTYFWYSLLFFSGIIFVWWITRKYLTR